MKNNKLLIKGGRILTVSSKIIEKGDILIKNGKIADIAEEINIRDADETIDATGLTITPGLIEAHCHIGIFEDSIGEGGNDGNESTDPLTPHLRAIDAINPMDRAFLEAISGGITTVSTGPGSSNILAGSFTIMKTYGHRVDKMVLKEVSAIKAAFGENPKRNHGSNGSSPKTRMAIAAMLREILQKAKIYLEKKEQIKKGEFLDYDIKYESLIPLLKGEIPLKVHAHRADDIFTAIRIIREFNLKATLDHCTDGHLIADDLKEEGFSTIVGPALTDRSKAEVKNLSFETAKALYDKGLLVAIITDHPEVPVNRLNVCAALCVKEGLSNEEALKMITINPAKILGIDKRVGSIEIGKDADIAIFDGDPLDARSSVKWTIIDGKVVYSA
ncbi:amidohydrolase [Clostridium cylindrosporum]|uniref:Amidohydrolase n=1 Tax=Clostridium cylindrosporum DSM 605 TaxID=1121307 RepID=A0A0J8DBB3_CLOCY|nr:amidohydrolase [Clostridium cylindrosporum]KMT23360.1 amidohydrolase [Clostridium cylindrosporum DSM 605]